jgi:FkbM family methyltransferase
MLKNICEENNIQFDINNKIIISNTIKHIKLDIGLSYSAPQSQSWLSNEDNLVVFGFEPNPAAVSCIKSIDNKKKDPGHGEVLEHRYINTNFFLIPVALGDSTDTKLPFYVTGGDMGCSSLLKPNLNNLPSHITLENVIDVPVFKLSDFFDMFPFDKFPLIEYIKIDAQGNDLSIIKSGGEYIKKHVVYVTLEAESNQYENSTDNNTNNIINYMETIGFLQINHTNTNDPTFVNKKFINEANSIYINQF